MKILNRKSQLGLEQLGDRIVPATFTWTYTGGGYGHAHDDANWSGSGLPGRGDDIYVPDGTGYIDSRGDLYYPGSIVIEAGWDGEWLTDGMYVGYGQVSPSELNDATFYMSGDVTFAEDVEIEDCAFLTAPGSAAKDVIIGLGAVYKGANNPHAGNLINNGFVSIEADSGITVAGSITNSGIWWFIGDNASVDNTGDFNSTGAIVANNADAYIHGYVHNNGGSITVGVNGQTNRNCYLHLGGSKIVDGTVRSLTSTGGSITVYASNTLQSAYGIVANSASTYFLRPGSTPTNPTDVTLVGTFTFNGGSVYLGESSASGAELVVNHTGGNVYFRDECYLNIQLDWTANKVSKWEASTFTIDNDCSVVLDDYNAPTPLTNNQTWIFLAASTNNGISGDFGNWFLPSGYGHSLNGTTTHNRITT